MVYLSHHRFWTVQVLHGWFLQLWFWSFVSVSADRCTDMQRRMQQEKKRTLKAY